MVIIIVTVLFNLFIIFTTPFLHYKDKIATISNNVCAASGSYLKCIASNFEW